MRLRPAGPSICFCILALTGCATRFETPGPAPGFTPVHGIAVVAERTDLSRIGATGETGMTATWLPRVQRYSDTLLTLFQASMPGQLQRNGLAVLPRAAGVPALYVTVASYEIACTDATACNTNLDLVGRLFGADDKPVWSFSTKIHAGLVDYPELRRIEDELIQQMLRDHLLAS